VSLIFKPFSDAEFVLCGAEEFWLVSGVLMALDRVRRGV
jgi:hypothetical protein